MISSADTGPLDADAREVGRVLGALFRLAHKAKARMASSSERYDAATFAVLVQLLETGPQRATALAAAMHADASTVSRQVSHLVDLRLVERQADPADGRACLLAATDAGSHTFTRMQAKRDEFLSYVVGDWTPEDRHQLGVLLGRFVDDMTTAINDPQCHIEPPPHAETAHLRGTDPITALETT